MTALQQRQIQFAADKKQSHPCRVYKVGKERGKTAIKELILVFSWMRERRFCAGSKVSRHTAPTHSVLWQRNNFQTPRRVTDYRGHGDAARVSHCGVPHCTPEMAIALCAATPQQPPFKLFGVSENENIEDGRLIRGCLVSQKCFNV